MFGKFSRRHFAKLAGLSALGIAAAPADAAAQAGSRAAGACEFSERLRVGHRHVVLSDRGRRERRRPRPLDLGYVRAHARQDRGQHHRRSRQRSLPPLQGRHRPDPGIGRQGLPVFDRVAAGVSGRNGQAEPQGPRLLRPPHRRTAQAAASSHTRRSITGICRRRSRTRSAAGDPAKRRKRSGIMPATWRRVSAIASGRSSRSTKPEGS